MVASGNYDNKLWDHQKKLIGKQILHPCDKAKEELNRRTKYYIIMSVADHNKDNVGVGT